MLCLLPIPNSSAAPSDQSSPGMIHCHILISNSASPHLDLTSDDLIRAFADAMDSDDEGDAQDKDRRDVLSSSRKVREEIRYARQTIASWHPGFSQALPSCVDDDALTKSIGHCFCEKTCTCATSSCSTSTRTERNLHQGDVYSREYCRHNCLFYFAKDLRYKGPQLLAAAFLFFPVFFSVPSCRLLSCSTGLPFRCSLPYSYPYVYFSIVSRPARLLSVCCRSSGTV